MRVGIEYQYSESFEFFTLFTRMQATFAQRVSAFGLQAQRAIDKSMSLYCALQYQEYIRDDTQDPPQRAIAFPKVLVLEHLQTECSPLTNFVRIYERAYLD